MPAGEPAGDPGPAGTRRSVGRRAFVVGAGAAALLTGTATPAAGAERVDLAGSAMAGALPDFHPLLKEELRFPLAWGTSPIRDFRAWRRAARAKVEEHLFVGRDDTPYEPEFGGERGEGDGYTRETVTFSLTRYGRVRGALLTPHGTGPFPAVLLLHDHGAKFDIGKEKLVRPWFDESRLASAQAWADRYFSGRFVGDELARRGYVVLAVDALGWGDRGPTTYEEQQALASNLYNLGSSLAGLMAREDVRAAGFLAGLDRVDRRRVAALGFSMGAFRAWQTAALSDDIAAAASVCWMTGLKEVMVPGNNILRGQSSYYMLHPGLARHLDFPDVASIGAPKPMLFLHGGQDPLFTEEGVRVAHEKLRAVWRSRHAGERLDLRIRPDLGHVFTAPQQDEVVDWFDSVL
ncbi:dienelactone hydrolase family protein [Streptomyces caniscabiei]|uniref:Dienelactone hydrolase family protein n=1 Tax=Streptomyces caniscabiei TaxID=2746961 RepID=A0ABU4MFS9_9ACTN|nr:dienelactone hydrolase family protein [Streptomyces caniscabiei]MBE4736229.1 dienelactone hydrolase family protein [Streptomyces caniscabiei]MBE4755643.1 dienelactone hydrolase family protein [Streptomyces caniscabiei]MBE4774259.1 dienelactone hydrolase family protein [Streptomyces caniscabiei]MBE4785804.1 dienelactone hydrolase family protein [Streptomyces caniscabiei]MBE4793825.1 dienelactone hydrolase family protein [Streptomyces caniscabiei]